jgi:two-component system sensor histidine kinase RegB
VDFVSTIHQEAAGIHIDAREIMRMLSNLINNAIEAGATRVQIEVARHLDAVHISVSDDGRGFSRDVLADLNSGISHLVAKPGHGFGLRHARLLAQAVNGKLWLRSNPFGGSCVTLAMPVDETYGAEV